MPATGVDWRRALRKLADGEEEGVFLVDVDRLKAQGLRAASADSAAAGKEEDIARTDSKRTTGRAPRLEERAGGMDTHPLGVPLVRYLPAVAAYDGAVVKDQ